jgi:radical SAM-linked protein
VQLGARKPSEAVMSEPAPRHARRKPPTRIDQGASTRVRLQLEKLGRAAYGSHLDFLRLLTRLLRRLSLPVYYSAGFNQKPVITFSPALPLGVLSLSEYVDLKLEAGAEIDLAELPSQLNADSVDGVRFVAARALLPTDAKLSRVIDRARYLAVLPRATMSELGVLDPAGDLARLQTLLDERMSGPLVVRRNVDGIGKRVDVGKHLLSVRVLPPEQSGAELLRAGLAGDLVSLELRIAISPEGSSKATEAVSALLGRDDLPVACVRTALYCSQGGLEITPLELERLRPLFSKQLPSAIAEG